MSGMAEYTGLTACVNTDRPDSSVVGDQSVATPSAVPGGPVMRTTRATILQIRSGELFRG
jgi:hypothetical protein